jgi:hypothetical protein
MFRYTESLRNAIPKGFGFGAIPVTDRMVFGSDLCTDFSALPTRSTCWTRGVFANQLKKRTGKDRKTTLNLTQQRQELET